MLHTYNFSPSTNIALYIGAITRRTSYHSKVIRTSHLQYVIYNILLFISLWYICLDCTRRYILENGPFPRLMIDVGYLAWPSQDGQWHQWHQCSLGRNEPPSEEPSGYLAYMNPMLGRVQTLYNEPQNRRPRRLQPWGSTDVSAINGRRRTTPTANDVIPTWRR